VARAAMLEPFTNGTFDWEVRPQQIHGLPSRHLSHSSVCVNRLIPKP
jgi:hypothetical protein